ncbi:gamma-glutamyltransferase [Arenimonas sp.]|uniref:gamma-glutamyltransferase n=1 Tax=Arenimonas sp. TaxID=1872635 RepID=UPI0039E2A28B
MKPRISQGAPERVAAAWLACFVLALCAATAFAKEPPRPARPPGAAIASAHRLATEAGQEILAKGGNAFDAAIAVSATLSVVEPVSSGIGGGGFFLLNDAKTGKQVFVDAREVAPASASPAFYLDAKGELDRDKAENGAASAGIPGLPAGLVHISKKYGRLPLSVSLAPAIRIAREGFPVYARIADQYLERSQVMERYASTRAVYLADGDAPKVGESLKQPALARTLELLAQKGSDGFYRGEVGKAMLDAVRADGVEWTEDDLAGYRVVEREPIRFKYRDWDIVTSPPPSSGGVALAEILQMLEGWDLAKLDEAHRVHIVVEAMRRAYRDRTLYLGDPDFTTMPIARLTSDDYAAGLRAGIMPDKATPSDMLPGGPAPKDSVNTTHFSIIDDEGNYVSATQTVNLSFGSGLVVAGFLLNDQMDDFALRPGTPNAYGVMGYDANAVAPRKRMLSSMTPTFMIGKDRVAVLGAKGGSRIITGVLLGVLGIEQGLDSSRIVALPRYHHQYLPDTIFHEKDALPAETVKALEAMGHRLATGGGPVVLMQSVDWDRASGAMHAGADPRNPVGAGVVQSANAEKKR